MEGTWVKTVRKQEKVDSTGLSLNSKKGRLARGASWTSALGSVIDLMAAVGLALALVLFADALFNYGKLSVELLIFLSESLGSGS